MRNYPRRNVYCLLGLPVDWVSMEETVQLVRSAVQHRHRLFLSTPNLNFLIGSRSNPSLRASVIDSDLSVADGMPLVWMAKLLRLPIKERVSGSGLFERLLQPPLAAGSVRRGWVWRMIGGGAELDPVDNDLFQRFLREPLPSGRRGLRVYFFGGPPGVAAVAHARINAIGAVGLRSVGFACPGFGTVEDMSGDDVINAINASDADLLIVALGAAKGQAWIEYNLNRLNVPVVSHLGAVVNFAAGTVDRAPLWMQRTGLEWLWRIKEEPQLWRRYWNDGWKLITLFLTRLLPYAVWLRWGGGQDAGRLPGSWHLTQSNDSARLKVTGDVLGELSDVSYQALVAAANAQHDLVVDLSGARVLGPEAWAQLLLLRQHLGHAGHGWHLEGLSSSLRQQMHWNGVDDLLAPAVMANRRPAQAQDLAKAQQVAEQLIDQPTQYPS